MGIWDYFKHYFSVDLLTEGSVIETLAQMRVMRNFILIRQKGTFPMG
jgi:hypothetical protein